MGYLHLDTVTRQSPKRAGSPCGDLVHCRRTAEATTLISCDGIGSGVRANLAAQMAVARLQELLDGGLSAARAFATVAATMEKARGDETVYPYAVFNLARIGPDGTATVLNYEAPPALLISGRRAGILPSTPMDVPNCSEATFVLGAGDSLVLVSDGITQSGIGRALPQGLGPEGVVDLLNRRLRAGAGVDDLAEAVHARALQLWGPQAGDDCTVLLATARRGVVVNLMTGPPSVAGKDRAVVGQFMAAEGLKAVCGATTAAVVARCSGRQVQVEQKPASLVAPPKYEIEGIDLVTEGAVTLNQAYNILDAEPQAWEEVSGVTELCRMLRMADRVNLTLGGARNPANQSIAFRQQGIIHRDRIALLLADKLRAMGKLVVVRNV